MKTYILPILVLVFSLQSCSSQNEEKKFEKKESQDTLTSSPFEIKVQWYGALKKMMHQGDLSAQVDLQKINHENLFALGAMENLKGEILIWDGQPLISKMIGEHITIDSSWNHKAALLVSSNINSWQTLSIPAPVHDIKTLTSFIQKQAPKTNIDIEKPFPFLIKGTVDSLQWHVIDWPDGDTVHTHQKHVTSGAYGTKRNIEVDILGFYSTEHKGIFTHHSSDVHMHFKMDGYPFAGHVDNIHLNEAELLLPKKIDTE